jgi:hypothetical protein
MERVIVLIVSPSFASEVLPDPVCMRGNAWYIKPSSDRSLDRAIDEARVAEVPLLPPLLAQEAAEDGLLLLPSVTSPSPSSSSSSIMLGKG